MKISFYFLLLSEVSSVESTYFKQLKQRMFTKHHTHMKTYVRDQKQRKEPQFPKLSMKTLPVATEVAGIQLQVPKLTMESKPAASMQLLKAKLTTRSQKIGAFERICTSQTCNKCYKLILIGRWESTKKHTICQYIITAPNCCQTAPLRSYF